MNAKGRAALAQMVYEAVRFSLWAAGQGVCPARGEDAVSPEDFLSDYGMALDIDDLDGLPVVSKTAIMEGQR